MGVGAPDSIDSARYKLFFHCCGPRHIRQSEASIMYCVSASLSSRVCATLSTLQSPLCDGRFDAGSSIRAQGHRAGGNGCFDAGTRDGSWKNLQLGPARGSTFFHATAHGGVAKSETWQGGALGTVCISSTVICKVVPETATCTPAAIACISPTPAWTPHRNTGSTRGGRRRINSARTL